MTDLLDGKTSPPSGLTYAAVRVSNFRGLAFVDLKLDRVTVILGANNAGKSSFLEALCAAVGAQHRTFGKDDIHLTTGEVDVAERFHDHALSNNWQGYRDCHIRPDLVLIYAKPDSDEPPIPHLQDRR
jgi:predicted ATPase